MALIPINLLLSLRCIGRPLHFASSVSPWSYPLVEEIFWRGFLLRFLINEDFERVAFGTFSWLSFAVVAIAFALSHTRADWVAGLITGMLYNVVAYRTKSLMTCVLTHAVTNLLLGLWIMKTAQWGFW